MYSEGEEDGDKGDQPRVEPGVANDGSVGEIHVPMDDTIVFNFPALQRSSIAVDTRYKRIVCLTCRTSVQPHLLQAHVQAHGFQNVAANLGADLMERHHVQPGNRIPLPPFPTTPIYGLEVVLNQVICPECNLGCASNNSFRKHHNDKHPGVDRRASSISACQTFFRGPTRRLFPVDISLLPAVAPHNNFDLYRRHWTTFQPDTLPLHAPANTRSLSLFLTQAHWMERVEGFTAGQIKDIVSVPQDDILLTSLEPHVVRWFNNAQRVFNDTDFNIITRISRGEEYVGV